MTCKQIKTYLLTLKNPIHANKKMKVSAAESFRNYTILNLDA